jgi:electron transfer flavoprotein alpha subunit
MADEGKGGVLVVGEVGGNGALRPVSLEIVTAGRMVAGGFGQPLVALLMGSGIDAPARELAATGVDRLLVVDDERLAGLTGDAATAVLIAAIDAVEPAVVLVPGTTTGRDCAARAAARLDAPLAADCVEFSVDGDALVAVRSILGGRVQTTVRLEGG